MRTLEGLGATSLCEAFNRKVADASAECESLTVPALALPSETRVRLIYRVSASPSSAVVAPTLAISMINHLLS